MAPSRAAALVAALLALGAAQAQLPAPDLSTGATSQADGNAGTEGGGSPAPIGEDLHQPAVCMLPAGSPLHSLCPSVQWHASTYPQLPLASDPLPPLLPPAPHVPCAGVVSPPDATGTPSGPSSLSPAAADLEAPAPASSALSPADFLTGAASPSAGAQPAPTSVEPPAAAATSPSATPASPATVSPPVTFSSPPLLNLPVGTPLPNPVFPITPQLPFLGNATAPSTPHVMPPTTVGPVPTTTTAPESAQGKGLINIRNGTIPFYPGINFTQPALTQPTAPQPQPPAVGATLQSNVPPVAAAPGVLEPTIVTAPPLVVQLLGGQPTGRENATGNFTTAYNGIPPGGNATAPQRNTTLLNVKAVNATAALYVSGGQQGARRVRYWDAVPGRICHHATSRAVLADWWLYNVCLEWLCGRPA